MKVSEAKKLIKKAHTVAVSVLIPEDVVYMEINKAQAKRFLMDNSEDGETYIEVEDFDGYVTLGK